MSKSTNLFLTGLIAIAAVGVIAILIVTKPKDNSSSTDKMVKYQLNGQERTAIGKPISGDPTKNARFVEGDSNAPVKIVEFANYQCSHCANFANEVEAKFISEFVDSGKVRYYQRYLSFNTWANADTATIAASCANDQSKFREYHSILFRDQKIWSTLNSQDLENKLTDYADQLALDTNTFKSCLQDNSKRSLFEQENKDAKSFGVTGTPAFIINGYRYEGELPIEALRAIIASVNTKQ